MPQINSTAQSDQAAILHAMSILAEPGQVVELRVLDVTVGRRWPHTRAGYFSDHNALAEAAAAISCSASGVYITVNPVNPALLARAANALKVAGRGFGTSDADVVRRRWLPVDIDPVRPAGISSTEPEKDNALATACNIETYLAERGWPDPIFADSGNGYHLLYLIDLANSDEAAQLVRAVLKRLAAQFDTPDAKVDTAVWNAARIWKLYGTLARKGDSTPERPHRRAEIVRVPDQVSEVSVDFLAALVAESKAGPDSRPPHPTSTTVAGAGQITRGQRHKVLTSLAGTMIKRGMLQAKIEADLLVTNQERCDPPYGADEIQHLVADLVRRYADNTSGQMSGPTIPENSGDLFDRDVELRKEIIAGVLREAQIAVLGGAYGKGKSPLLQDIAVRLAHGLPFAGRAVEKRPVAFIDLETPAAIFKSNVQRISARLGVEVPMPEQLEVYLEHDVSNIPSTAVLLQLLRGETNGRVAFLRQVLARKPNAVIIIDPLELLFPFEKRNETEVLDLYQRFRFLLADFPEAAMVTIWNLRKRDRAGRPPNLLVSPRDWLEEVSGSIAIMNRSDVRLGFDSLERDPEICVINGIRRGEDFHPLLLRPVGMPGELSGFEQIRLEGPDLDLAFAPRQLKHWHGLPPTFTFEQIADKTVPRSSLSRLLERAESFGLITKTGATFQKLPLAVPPCTPPVSFAPNEFAAPPQTKSAKKPKKRQKKTPPKQRKPRHPRARANTGGK